MNIPTQKLIDKLVADFNLTRHMISIERDDLVMCPDPQWIVEFAAWLYQHRPAWISESSDCDDIARWAQVAASTARAEAGGIPSGNSVLVATIDGVKGRRLNGIPFTHDYCIHDTLLILDNTEQWWFVEPQTGEYCHAQEAISDNNPNGPVAGIDYVSL